MKSILFICPGLGSGGAERQICNCAIGFKEKGYPVSLVCYGSQDFYLYLLQSNGIIVDFLTEGKYLKRLYSITQYINRGKFDVVISFLKTPSLINLFTSFFTHRHIVITSLRGVPFFPWGKLDAVANLQFKGDYIVSNSENAKNVWLQSFPKHANKFRVIYNIISIPSLTTEYKMKRNGKINIVIAASIYHVKKPDGLIEALSHLTQSEKDRIVFNWYGKKSNEIDINNYNNLIKKYSIENCLKFHNPTKDIYEIMNMADIVALLSKNEGLPNVICEGMMLGKPILMTRVSDYRVLCDSENGFLCDYDDVKSILQVLKKILATSDEKMIEMGRKSREKAEKLFSREKLISQWISLFEDK